MIAHRSNDRIEYVLTSDPAIDAEHPDYDWDRYLKTADPKYAPIKEGHTPTVFSLSRLTRRQFLRVMSLPDQEQSSEAVKYGLRAIKDLGRPVELRFKRYGDLGEGLDSATLDHIFSPDLFAELGVRIMTMSTLDPTFGRA